MRFLVVIYVPPPRGYQDSDYCGHVPWASRDPRCPSPLGFTTRMDATLGFARCRSTRAQADAMNDLPAVQAAVRGPAMPMHGRAMASIRPAACQA